jgi:maleate isomerase
MKRAAINSTHETPYRLGLVVPSSNTTMETELPEMFRRMSAEGGPQLTVHSSRMRMRTVSPEELLKMDAQADRCVEELADAEVDAIAYACLVAVMCQGPEYALELERRLKSKMGDSEAPVITSAGALNEALSHLGAKRVSLIAPYLPGLTEKVVQGIEAEGVEVIDAISLSIADNLEVGRRSPHQLIEEVKQLDVRGADAVILSACVQMPSLAAVPIVEAALGIPVISAATATVFALKQRFGWDAAIPNAGRLLGGAL